MIPRIIAVCGGSGSGKTTLVTRLCREHGSGDIMVLHMDHYYKDLSHLAPEERDRQNFDHPDAFEMPLLRSQIAALREGRSIERPTYDFATHTRTAETVRLTPPRLIVLDGILSLHDPDLRRMFDLKVFVDVDDDVRFIRRLRRDVVERGRTVDSVIGQYLASVKEMHDVYVAPQKLVADLIISWMTYNDRAVAMLSAWAAAAL
jgi:uridine kinase